MAKRLVYPPVQCTVCGQMVGLTALARHVLNEHPRWVEKVVEEVRVKRESAGR